MLDLDEIAKDVHRVSTLDELEEIRVQLLGRNGKVNALAKNITALHGQERASFGRKINSLKKGIAQLIDKKKKELHEKTLACLVPDDPTLPGIKREIGRLHPTTLTIRHIVTYFTYLGYSVYEGPEIETDEYNFDKLNLPLDHPARELQDTLYIREPDLLLRTHTSSVETRCMSAQKMPIRIIAPGKCYRNESANATNNSIFYQLEGLVVDKGITMGHLKATLEGFVSYLYGDDIETRFRCKYYPQVEPGAGLDVRHKRLDHDAPERAIYKGRDWIEVLGAGMVHPNVLRKCGIDPSVFSGFAFGMGLDRLVMLRYGITDIRTLYSGEVVWK
jgi:phenylalanyl-tRNA synthetase alpha chain